MEPSRLIRSTAVAMGVLRRARESQRDVVALYGAGVSADAGIPLAMQLSEYLISVYTWVKMKRYGSVRTYLRGHRWPSRHDLRHDLDIVRGNGECVGSGKPGSKPVEPQLEELLKEMLHHESRKTNPMAGRLVSSGLKGNSPADIRARLVTGTSYRSLLSYLCDNDQNLIDGCFDHFTRDRRITSTHQFVTFLAQALSMRVILTTNFDSLIDDALGKEGLSPAVYAVTGDSTIPSPQLLLAQRMAVVKLHGGTYQLRTGVDLDDPLSPSSLLMFSEFFRKLKSPLLMVLGYGGADRRVMDIVTERVRAWESGDPTVLWIARKAEPPELLTDAAELAADRYPTAPGMHSSSEVNVPAVVTKYRDARLFLQDVQHRLMKSYSVSTSQYQAVAFVPRSPAMTLDDQTVSSFKDQGILPAAGVEHEKSPAWRCGVVIPRTMKFGEGEPQQNGKQPERRLFGTSELAAIIAEHLDDGGHKTIWVDLGEVRSVSTLITILSEQFMKLDARLNGIARPVLLDGLFSRVSQGYETKSEATGEPWLSAEEVEKFEIEMAVRWIRHVLRRDRYLLVLDSLESFGAWHPAMETAPSAIEGGLEAERRRQEELLSKVLSEIFALPAEIGDSRILVVHGNAAETKKPGSPILNWLEKEHQRMKERQDHAVRFIKSLSGGPGEDVGEFAERLLKVCTANEQELLFVAAACRRPRSTVTLIEVSLKLARPGGDEDPRLQKELEAILDGWVGFQKLRAGQIKIGGFISRQEGGYIWMHRDLRDEIYRRMRRERGLKRTGEVHGAIADFAYRHVFERSQDVRAFLEYVFHGVCAVAYTVKGVLALEQAESIARALNRDKEKLLSRGRLASVLRQADRLIVIVESWKFAQRDLKRRKAMLLNRLYSFAGDVLLTCGHPHWATRCHTVRVPEALGTGVRKEQRGDAEPLATWCNFITKKGKRGEISLERLEKLLDVAKCILDPYITEFNGARGWQHRAKTRENFIGKLFTKEILRQVEASSEKIECDPQSPERALILARYVRYYVEFALRRLDKYRYRPRLSVYFGTRRSADAARKLKGARAWKELWPGAAGKNESVGFKEALAAMERGLRALERHNETKRAKRYRCYLLTRKALALMAERGERKWKEANESLDDAEAMLEREAGGAERLASGVTHIIRSELSLRRAEALWVKKQWANHRQMIEREVNAAEVYLRQAEDIFEEARGENRWRWQRFHLLARQKMLKAKLLTLHEPHKALDELFQAGRWLMASYTNSGKKTDRRLALNVWWHVWQEMVRSMGATGEGGEFRKKAGVTLLGDWRQRLGLSRDPKNVTGNGIG